MICSALHHHSSRILGCPVTRVVSGRAPHFDKSITLSLPGFFADGRAFLPHKPGRPRHPYTSSPTHPLAEPKGPLLLTGDRDLKINEGPGPSWYCKPCLQVDEISPLLLVNGVDLTHRVYIGVTVSLHLTHRVYVGVTRVEIEISPLETVCLGPNLSLFGFLKKKTTQQT